VALARPLLLLVLAVAAPAQEAPPDDEGAAAGPLLSPEAAEAEAAADRAVQAARGGAPLGLAAALEERGFQRFLLGRYDEAEADFDEAWTLDAAHPGAGLAQDRRRVRTLRCRARMRAWTGRLVEAREVYLDLLPAVEAHLGTEVPYYLVELLGLAQTLLGLGRLAEAEVAYERLLTLADRVLAPEDPIRITALVNAGSLYSTLGRPELAEPLLRAALEDAAEDELARPHALAKLALAVLALGRLEEGEQLASQALVLARERLPSDVNLRFEVLNHLALALGADGRAEDEERLRREFAAEMEDAPGLHPAARSRNLENLAWALVREERLDEARTLLDEALDLERGIREEPHRDLARLLSRRARVDVLRGDGESALPFAREAASVYERARERVAPGIERSTFAQSPYGCLALTLLTLGETEEAWSAVERGHARALLDALGKAPSGALTLGEARASLRSGERFLGWVDLDRGVGRPELWAWAVRGEPTEDAPAGLFWARIPDADVERLRGELAELRARLVKPGEQVFGAPDPAPVRALGAEVGERLLAPLAGMLTGARHVTVLGSDVLGGIPLEALLGEDERFTVSYAPSASVHASLVERAAASRAGSPASGAERRALVLGDPPYRPDHLEPATAGGEADGDRARGSTFEDARPELLPRLVFSRAEAASVAALFPRATLLLGREASEVELARLAADDRLRTFDTIHLAAHGRVDDLYPERSELFLSQVDLPDAFDGLMRSRAVDDGRLTAAEILATWRLEADLVTLSACETGLGRRVEGEGFVGFAHAFFEVGARSVLVSLWPVDDEATSLLMGRFYELLLAEPPAGEPAPARAKAEALAAAKRWLRERTDERGARPYEHPWFWSGFVLVGAPD